jgi:hypothetical protein
MKENVEITEDMWPHAGTNHPCLYIQKKTVRKEQSFFSNKTTEVRENRYAMVVFLFGEETQRYAVSSSATTKECMEEVKIWLHKRMREKIAEAPEVTYE